MASTVVSFVFQNQEIEELTKICDELIAKLGKTDWVSPVRSVDLHLAASVVTTVILPYPGIVAPLQRKDLEKAHAHCCLSCFAAGEQPWKNPGALHRRRRSGIRPSRSPHSTAPGSVDRLLSWVCDFSVLILFFSFTTMYFITIFSTAS